jgi:hypothetical protein
MDVTSGNGLKCRISEKAGDGQIPGDGGMVEELSRMRGFALVSR